MDDLPLYRERKPIDSIRSMIVDHNKIDSWFSMAGFY